MSRANPFVAHTTTVGAGVAVATLLVAGAVHVVLAEPARRWLDFPFTGLSPGPRSVISILGTNVRLFGLGIAAVVLALALMRPPRRTSDLSRMTLAALDSLVLLEVVLNVAVVGTGLGAYGWRMVAAVLPHGPIELAAFALVLTLYLQARRRSVTRGAIVRVAVTGLALLIVAAGLETYVAF